MPDAGTIIAIVLLVLAAVVAVRLIRRRIKGKAGCGCGCSECDGATLALLNADGVDGQAHDGASPRDLPPCCRGAESHVGKK